MKKLALFLVTVGLMVSFIGTTLAETYRVGTLRWAGYSSVFVAEHKGFWKDEGVDVELKAYTSIPDYVNAAVNNRVHLAMMPIATLVDFRKAGLDELFLGAIVTGVGENSVVIKKNLTNKSLKGQIIGIPANESNGKFVLATYLRQSGTKLNDVKLVYMSVDNLAKNFISGRIPVVQMYGPARNKALKEGNGTIVYQSTTGIYGLGGQRVALDKIPQGDMKKIQRGVVRANNWIRDPANQKELFELVNKKIFPSSPDFPAEVLHAMFSEVKLLTSKEMVSYNQVEVKTDFKNLKQIFMEEGSLKGEALAKFNFSEIIPNKTLIQVAKKLQ